MTLIIIVINLFQKIKKYKISFIGMLFGTIGFGNQHYSLKHFLWKQKTCETAFQLL
jgi:hypothetical protein